MGKRRPLQADVRKLEITAGRLAEAVVGVARPVQLREVPTDALAS